MGFDFKKNKRGIRYFRFMISSSSDKLVVVLVGDSDALESGFEVSDVHVVCGIKNRKRTAAEKESEVIYARGLERNNEKILSMASDVLRAAVDVVLGYLWC